MRALRDPKSSLQVHRKKGSVVVNKNLPQVNDFMAQRDPLQRAPYVTRSPSESEGSDEKKRHYVEKSVIIDSDTPELVAFYQRYSHEYVKDIFMDMEAPSLMKRCLVENCELDHENISCMLNSDVGSTSESTGETLKTVSSMSNDCSNKDVIKRCGSVTLVMEPEEDSDAIVERVTNCSIEKIVPERQQVREVTSREADVADYMVSYATEAIDDKSHTSREALCKSEMESGNINSKEGFHQNDQGQGECDSFSVGSLSCRTADSGQIPYSESISIRSHSSTASSRSFAFPILASEWHGSPVRMVKPDRRLLIKQRNRKMRFLCCQF